jgi:hypothetical protein
MVMVYIELYKNKSAAGSSLPSIAWSLAGGAIKSQEEISVVNGRLLLLP